MPENTPIDHKKKEPKTITTAPVDITMEDEKTPQVADIVSAYIGKVMMDRNRMPEMEKALDSFLATYYKRTQEEKVGFKAQMENAKLSIESLYNRLLQQL